MFTQLASTGGTKFCNSVIVRPCTNHTAKNCGGAAKDIGKNVHTKCDCPVKLTRDGAPYATGAKNHRGLNTDDHPLIKTWQRGLSAALRGAKAGLAGTAAYVYMYVHVYVCVYVHVYVYVGRPGRQSPSSATAR